MTKSLVNTALGQVSVHTWGNKWASISFGTKPLLTGNGYYYIFQLQLFFIGFAVTISPWTDNE